jgi:aromatic-L-amino-acid/L-tryptophan decarboxylase
VKNLSIESDANQRSDLGRVILDYVNRSLQVSAEGPASSPPATAEVISTLLAPPPETGAQLETLLKRLDAAFDTGFDTNSAGFLSYIPTGGLYTSALGSFIGAATNRYTGGSHASPGAVAIEQSVIDWMTDLFGLPQGSAGILLSGGSVANLTAVVAARTRLGDNFHDGVIYASERSHHSIDKAARIAGISADRLRKIPVSSDLRIDIDALRAAVETDQQNGLRPMMVVATAGTTDTGTVDPLVACADIADAAGTWFHVDAAYGGFFQLTARGRDLMTGIDRADSITVDAHKSLFLPFGVGGLLVRDPQTLVVAHEGHGAYMQDVLDQGLPHYFALGPELTRPNRGISVWLPLQLHGVAQFRAVLDGMLDLARWTAEQLTDLPGIEVSCNPQLSVVAFRSSDSDATSRRIFEHLIASRAVHISSTEIDGRFIIRLAFLSQRTKAPIARRVVDLIKEALALEAPGVSGTVQTQ